MLDDHGQLIRAREKALKGESGGDAETVVYFGGYHREESYYLRAWEVSSGHCPPTQRTLARRTFEK